MNDFNFVSGRRFIYKNRNVYQCEGNITSSGQCEGKLQSYTVQADSDYCFVRNSFSVINDYVCIGASIVQVVNGIVRCESANNSPVLVMKIDKFNDMCKNLSDKVEYKYIADPNNPSHIQIPNPNKYVLCSNNEPNVCIFSETNTVTGTNIISTGNRFSSNVIFN